MVGSANRCTCGPDGSDGFNSRAIGTSQAQNAESLAIQQELLRREQLQSDIEEFIFQTEKLVLECSDSTSDVPESTKYFLCESILERVNTEGLNTALIRGKGNKLAFEEVMRSVQTLRDKLVASDEVQQALAWAKKLESDRQSALADRNARREEIRKQMAPTNSYWSRYCHPEMVQTLQDASNEVIKQFTAIVVPNKTIVIVCCVILNFMLIPILLVTYPLTCFYKKAEMDRAKKCRD